MANRHPQEDHFPPIDFGDALDPDETLSDPEAPSPNGEPTPAAGRPRGQNRLRPNDSLTRCPGFINAIQQHEANGRTYYAIRVGLLQGSKKNEKDEWIGDITNCYLLLGPTLRKWAETMHGLEDPFRGVRCILTIRNLKFYLGTHNDEPVVRSRGALETITFGHLTPMDRP